MTKMHRNPARSISWNGTFSQRIMKTVAATGSMLAMRLAFTGPIMDTPFRNMEKERAVPSTTMAPKARKNR